MKTLKRVIMASSLCLFAISLSSAQQPTPTPHGGGGKTVAHKIKCKKMTASKMSVKAKKQLNS